MALLAHISMKTEVTGTGWYVGWYRRRWQVTTTFQWIICLLPHLPSLVSASYLKSKHLTLTEISYVQSSPMVFSGQRLMGSPKAVPGPGIAALPSILSTAKRYQRPTFCLQLNFQSQSLLPLHKRPPPHSIVPKSMSKSKAACPWRTAWPGTLICGPLHIQAMCSPCSVATPEKEPNFPTLPHSSLAYSWGVTKRISLDTGGYTEAQVKHVSSSHGATKILWSSVSSAWWELATPEAVKFLDEWTLIPAYWTLSAPQLIFPLVTQAEILMAVNIQMQKVSFSKLHCLLTNGHCLTTCPINFQNQHLTTLTWVWMSALKNIPSQNLQYTASSKSCSSFFTCWSHRHLPRTSYSLCNCDPLHTRPPSQLNASTKHRQH